MKKLSRAKSAIITDPVFSRYLSLVTEVMIPYQYRMLCDKKESHCIENFRIAAGLSEGEFEGWVFQDSDLAKWLEAAAYSLTYRRDDALEAQADRLIELMKAAQLEDGYLNTYFTIRHPGCEFKNLKEGHELYTAGHEIEAACAYYGATGKDELLKIAIRIADHICEVFHTPEYETAVPGHEEIELALVRLWETTGEAKYLDMAKDFIDRRGKEPNYLAHEHEKPDYIDVWHDKNAYIPEYGQAHAPVREQKTAEGHAVRAMYLYSAMTDVAAAADDSELLYAAERLYRNTVQRRMYITGGVGSSGTLERFTTDFDLPNERGYSESCAAIGLCMFSRRLASVTGEAGYFDTVERALYNNVLAGVSLDGERFFYVNPLEVWPDSCLDATDLSHVKAVRQPWFGCACCPPNIARTLASVSDYAYFIDGEDFYVNLLIGGEADGVRMTSQLPWKGLFRAELPKSVRRLHLRIPPWLENAVICADGAEITPKTEKGYAIIENAEAVTLTGGIRPKKVFADPRVRADAGRCAVTYGPLVYCIEEADNGDNLASVFIKKDAPLSARFDDELFGGCVIIEAEGVRLSERGGELYSEVPPEFTAAKLRLVPYAYWNNRSEGEMSVWLKVLF